MKFAIKLLAGVFATAVLFVTQLPGQEMIKPGPEHKFLAEVEGEWNVKLETPGGEWTGKCTYKMVHGGLWLASEMDAKMPEGPFTGQGLDTYNPMTKKFTGIWVDSMSVSPVMLEGERSADGKTLTMTGKGPGMDGKTTDIKTVTEYNSKDKHTFKMWMGQTTGDPVMSAVYERKK